MSLEFKFDDEGFKRAGEKLPKAILNRMRQAMRAAGAEFEQEYVERKLSRPSHASLGRRTGSLRQNFAARALYGTESLDTLQMVWGFGHPAVPNWVGGWNAEKVGVHETGATIRPKHAQNLAIPAKAAMTRAGVSRYGSPRENWAALRFGMSRRTGKKWLQEAFGGPHARVMYWLVPEVRIPARLDFGLSVRSFWPRAQKRMAEAVKKAGGDAGMASVGVK